MKKSMESLKPWFCKNLVNCIATYWGRLGHNLLTYPWGRLSGSGISLSTPSELALRFHSLPPMRLKMHSLLLKHLECFSYLYTRHSFNGTSQKDSNPHSPKIWTQSSNQLTEKCWKSIGTFDDIPKLFPYSLEISKEGTPKISWEGNYSLRKDNLGSLKETSFTPFNLPGRARRPKCNWTTEGSL